MNRVNMNRIDYQDGSELHFGWGSRGTYDGVPVMWLLHPFPGFVPGSGQFLAMHFIDRNGKSGQIAQVNGTVGWRELAEDSRDAVEAFDALKAMSNAPCSDRPKPLVDAVIAAHEALIAAQEAFEASKSFTEASWQAMEARDKARDAVLAAAAKLAEGLK